MIQKAAVGLDTITDEYSKADDVDVNGVVNIKDVTWIQKHIVGINTDYNIGSAI